MKEINSIKAVRLLYRCPTMTIRFDGLVQTNANRRTYCFWAVAGGWFTSLFLRSLRRISGQNSFATSAAAS